MDTESWVVWKSSTVLMVTTSCGLHTPPWWYCHSADWPVLSEWNADRIGIDKGIEPNFAVRNVAKKWRHLANRTPDLSFVSGLGKGPCWVISFCRQMFLCQLHDPSSSSHEAPQILWIFVLLSIWHFALSPKSRRRWRYLHLLLPELWWPRAKLSNLTFRSV